MALNLCLLRVMSIPFSSVNIKLDEAIAESHAILSMLVVIMDAFSDGFGIISLSEMLLL